MKSKYRAFSFLLLSTALWGSTNETDTTRCVLLITTVPAHGSVFIGDQFIGTAPLTTTIGKNDSTILELRLEDYQTYKTPLYGLNRDTIRLVRVMKSLYSYLSVELEPEGSHIFIDRLEVGKDTARNYKIPFGIHTIQGTHALFENTLFLSLNTLPDERISVRGRLDGFSWKAFNSSLLIPGSGQMMHGNTWKGTVFLFAAAGFLVTAISTEGYYFYNLQKYRSLKEDIKNAYPEAKQLSIAMEARQYYDNAARVHSFRNSMFVGFAVVYFFNLTDALVNHSANDTFDIYLNQVHSQAAGPSSFNVTVSTQL
jgi:hypothetical protein